MQIYLFSSRTQVLQTKLDSEKDGIVVPSSIQEYCIAAKPKPSDCFTDFDFYDDDYIEDCEDEDAGNCSGHDEEEEDSGNSDSWWRMSCDSIVRWTSWSCDEFIFEYFSNRALSWRHFTFCMHWRKPNKNL